MNNSREHGRAILWILILVVVVAAAGMYLWQRSRNQDSSAIAFAPYSPDYSSKMDFAQLEHDHPLTPEQRKTLTPEILKGWDQEKVDQIYARLTAGPIPDGAFNGDLFFPKGQSGRKRLSEIAGGLMGAGATLELDKLTLLGKALWKGKVFYRDQRVLRNRIDHFEALTDFFPDPSDQARLRELTTNGKKDQLYFPAKLYCGQSLLDSRKESVIIDYAFTDDLEGYREVPDKLAGREGLIVRDEIRMVRPGFYLGRAYMANSFILNFTLVNGDTKSAPEDCWTGPQPLTASR